MEDEDVDNVNSSSDTAVVNDALIIKNDVKKRILPEDTCAEGESVQHASINNLKSSIDCNDKESSGSNDLLNASRQTVNGEVDKNENVTSLEGDDVRDKVGSRRSKDKEVNKEVGVDGNNVGKSMKRKLSVTGSSEGSNISENEVDAAGESSSESSTTELKSLKKRKVTEVEKEKDVNMSETNKQVESDNSTVDEVTKPKPMELRRSARNAANAKKNNSESVASVDTKEDTGDQLTEYAQYLGLQPTLKFKCSRCGEKHFQSMASLNAHQMICCKTVTNVLTKQTKPQSETNLSTNFRITRKVYLCSACGTYYENWKLFLHMRDMHKRHICLFCLGMFSVAERLADHLLYQHNVHEKTCKSPEEFLNLFKGSCYLTCCTCEKMFTEREDFHDHLCKDSLQVSNNEPVTLTAKELKELAQKCALCGVKCGHFRTCPKVAHKFQNVSPPLPDASPPMISNGGSNLERFYIPVSSKIQTNWPQNNINQDILKQALSGPQGDKDYYDAASFCHVDMAANDSDNLGSPITLEEHKNSERKCTDEDDDDNKSLAQRLSEVMTKETNEKAEHGDETSRLLNDNLTSVSDNSSSSKNQSDDKQIDNNTSKVSDVEILDTEETNDKEIPIEKEVEESVCSPKSLQRLDEIDSSLKSNEGNITNDNTSDDKKLNDKSDVDNVEDLPCAIKGDEFCDNEKNSAERSEDIVNEDNVTNTENDVINSETNNTEDKLPNLIKTDELMDDNTSNMSEESVEKNKETIPVKENTTVSTLNHTPYGTVQCSVRLDRLDDSVKYTMSNSLNEDIQTEHNSSYSNDSDSSASSSSSGSSSNSSRRSSMDTSNINTTEDNVPNNDPILNNEDMLTHPKEPLSKDSSIVDEDVKKLDNGINDVDNDDTKPDTDSVGSENEDLLNKSNELVSNDTCNELANGSSKDEGDVINSESENESIRSVTSPVVETRNPEALVTPETIKELSDESEGVDCDSIDKHKDVEESGITEKDSQIKSKSDNNVEEESHENNCTVESEEEKQIEEGTTENNVETEEEPQKSLPPKELSFKCDGVTIQLASEEVLAMALTLEDKMESLNSKCVVKECVRTSCTTCTYCSHAVKIGVNGKQLAVHLLTEHRYMPVKNESTEDVIERLKGSLTELQDIWFNTDSYDSSDKSCFVPYDQTYECFQCNYVTNTHKDLFSHKRKVHQKTILYCSMCKESFYSYSELLCHMCPGLYDATKDINFRCCLCDSDRIPSAFRLMVHLRKTHQTCDICLEVVDDQQKLSAHMVKHKLHHLCYRCGIAYRNKPDITKHLFWKHGTESVMCKKCLQKKWPHVYHFCVPPTTFICDECNLSFSKAVYLKVHKRFHNNNLPYSCETCKEKFVSKKLLVKHETTHETPVMEEEKVDNTVSSTTRDPDTSVEENEIKADEATALLSQEPVAENCENSERSDEATAVKPHKKKNKKDKDKKVKPVVDVYDLPPLNLSSESDETDDEKEVKLTPIVIKEKENEESEKVDTQPSKEEPKELDIPIESSENETNEKPEDDIAETSTNPTESMMEAEDVAPVTVVDGVWDSFHNYKAEQEKREHLDIVNKESLIIRHSVLDDHDYCKPNVPDDESADDIGGGHSSSMDHDYCSQNKTNGGGTPTGGSNLNGSTDAPTKKKQKSPKKKAFKVHNSSSSSDSSTDSDSSSCSCGTNCSCSSSSSNSSSSSSSDSDSSSSDGKLNTSSSSKKEKKKSKNKRKSEVVNSTDATPLVNGEPVNVSIEPEEPLIRESDLDTDETATDEDFYDQYPQMRANQILSEKRDQLMMLAAVAPTVNNGTLSPPISDLNATNTTNINLDSIGSPKLEIVTPPVTPTAHPQNKRKAKAKKRRKSSFSANKYRKQQHERNLQQLETTPQPSTSFSSIPPPALSMKSTLSDGLKTTIYKQQLVPANNGPGNMSPHVQGNTGSTNSSKRASKRRRVRNKFYGYSSDEDPENQQTSPTIKWTKMNVTSADSNSVKQTIQQPINAHAQVNSAFQHHPPTPKTVPPMNIRAIYESSQSHENMSLKRPAAPPTTSSSSSSEEDSDSDSGRLLINQHRQMAPTMHQQLMGNAGSSAKDEKLYCYCQCPYDEVSEMIACDGMDCSIEWFHFECVGIMVPPKGKWYCPHCRKKRGLS